MRDPAHQDDINDRLQIDKAVRKVMWALTASYTDQTIRVQVALSRVRQTGADVILMVTVILSVFSLLWRFEQPGQDLASDFSRG